MIDFKYFIFIKFIYNHIVCFHNTLKTLLWVLMDDLQHFYNLTLKHENLSIGYNWFGLY
jgi:hypothetical protein